MTQKTTILKTNNCIDIKGARVHNLKTISLKIPRDKLVVITGLSGSGKSSLAFDTIYAEGQRRYVESLSSYARQFLGRLNKPEVEYIKGIPPAIAIEQKVNTRNPRSTVGTSTEIYDYIKLLYARIGKTYSPITGKLIKRHRVTDVIDCILKNEEGTKVMIVAPSKPATKRTNAEQLEILQKQGYNRIVTNFNSKKSDSIETVSRIDDILSDKKQLKGVKNINIVIDRIKVRNDEDTISRMGDSIQTAFFEGHGECFVEITIDETKKVEKFSSLFEENGIEFEEPSVNMFSFNNPLGACKTCEGFGSTIGIDPDLVIPNKNLSIYEDAVICWRGEKMQKWKNKLIYNADKFDFPIHRPYFELSEAEKQLLWTGNKYFEGLNDFFEMLQHESYKIQYRIMLSRYRGKTVCPDCRGTRLKKEAGYVKINGKSIQDLMLTPIYKLIDVFKKMKFSEYEQGISKRLLIEINNRLQFLDDVGLGYLTLNRLSSTLSGGESQRINLATSLGSSLVGSLYILDEPSIGLHSRDTNRLISVLKRLRDIGNTVIVVEHEEEIMRAADYLIDIGPQAGRLGGEIVFTGTHNDLLNVKKSLTADYLTGKATIEVPKIRRKWNNYIEIIHARENNLKNINVKFPLNILTVVTGVSGSGKSSLVKTILYSAINKHLGGYGDRTGRHDAIQGDLKLLSQIEFIDQNPIGRSSRSNPVTYIKAYDDIRKLFSQQQAAKINNFKPAHFSFNVEGGRCEECQGEGIIKVEMQFMADVYLQCEVCGGKRFKDDVLEVKYKDKNIFDILDMTIDEAYEFFNSDTKNTLPKKVADKLKLLVDVGMGYVKLGQSSSTLSGGESQRIKLASFLAKERQNTPTMFIFDEPTTGLHFHDIKKLLAAFNALIDRNNTIVVIEHNAEIIKNADWIIDLGPEGGDKGGEIMFEGIPEDLIKCEKSYTGKHLKNKIEKINETIPQKK